MFNYKDEISNIEKKILTESKKHGMIENGNYILAMELKEIREGKLNSVEDKYGIIPSYVKQVPQEKTAIFPFEYLKVLAKVLLSVAYHINLIHI